MIRKVLFWMIVFMPFSLYAAEEMRFATMLSTPGGAFATLEVTDPTVPVEAIDVSFGSPYITQNRTSHIYFRGNNAPFLGQVYFTGLGMSSLVLIHRNRKLLSLWYRGLFAP